MIHKDVASFLYKRLLDNCVGLFIKAPESSRDIVIKTLQQIFLCSFSLNFTPTIILYQLIIFRILITKIFIIIVNTASTTTNDIHKQMIKPYSCCQM